MDGKSLMTNTMLAKSLAFLCLFFSCKEDIPVVKIDSPNPLIWTQKLPCEITIQKSDKSSVSYNAIAKYRGGMSASYAKNSLTVEFEEKVSFGDIEKDDDWIFNASYIDKTFMRHKICSDMFLAMHSDNRATHATYVELVLNDSYQGLFVAMEEINASNLGLDKSDSMAILFKDPPIFFEDRIPFPQDSLNYYQQKFPKKELRDHTEYLENFRKFLFESSDEIFLAEIEQWVDVRNLLDWHLWLLLTNNGDGVLKNFYMYKLNGKTSFRFAVWDCDSTFGRDADNEPNHLEREVPIERSILFSRLMNIPESNYLSKLKARWHELRDQKIFSNTNFLAKIKYNKKIVKPYIAKNLDLWPNNGYGFYDDNNFQEEVNLMKEMYRIRLAQLDKRFDY